MNGFLILFVIGTAISLPVGFWLGRRLRSSVGYSAGHYIGRSIRGYFEDGLMFKALTILGFIFGVLLSFLIVQLVSVIFR